jgi:hypothetical protein
LALNSLVAKDDSLTNQPSVDLHIKGGEATLVLSISLYGTWRPEYHMPMTSLATDKVDVLQALLRDAQDEIVTLTKHIESLESRDVGDEVVELKQHL